MFQSGKLLESLTVSAPGRICIAGEHQDYLGLPVIPAAINRRIYISGKLRNDQIISIELPDINSSEQFRIDVDEIPYTHDRDYFRSVIDCLRNAGIKMETGCDIDVRGNIPINSGTSSSSALCVAWTKFLLTMAQHRFKDIPYKIGYLAYISEVENFGEPGGQMDHLASAFGRVIFLDNSTVVPLPEIKGTFVLGDSHQRKDTIKTLARIKNVTLLATKKIKADYPEFSLQKTGLDEIKPLLENLPDEEMRYLEGALKTRELTKRARHMLESGDYSNEDLGHLLDLGHDILRNYLRVSTDKIDRMLESAKSAGAYGGKINGSGEGGCMFAYAPDDPEKVSGAINDAGGTAHIVRIDDGVRVESEN